MNPIPFNVPPFLGPELEKIAEAVASRKISGDGVYSKRCSEWLEREMRTSKALLTTSCSDALELSALLADIQPGDEVICPSYTFVSTANAFVLRGAKIVFVDIRPDTMNIDEKLIEAAITPKTKAIAPVHYAGVSCEMDEIMRIAKKYHLSVIEDAAQGIFSTYHGKALGTLGDYGCLSFHETKNLSMGEGGAILIQDPAKAEQAEIFREKGTNRSQFWRGQVDKYTWVSVGSSFLPSEINAAYLFAQFENADLIHQDRMTSWNRYYERFESLANRGRIELPVIPVNCAHNAHMFYLKAKDLDERTRLLQYLKAHGVEAVFHYVPLHSSPAGLQFGRFHGEDRFTTRESDRLVRLPLFYGLTLDQLDTVVETVESFYREN